MASYYTERVQYKTAKELRVEKTIQEIRQGLRVLVLMRGLPGSGKSFLAKEILNKGLGSTDYSTFIFSADDYFLNKRTGKYIYDREKLSDAHENAKKMAFSSMAAGVSPVIIDNTNTELWEMAPYAKEAMKHHYMIEIIEPFTKWAFKVHELAQRNSHNVPLVKLQQMLDRYDKNMSVEKLLSFIGAVRVPPTYRLFPPLYYLPPDDIATVQNANTYTLDLNKRTSKQDVIYISEDEERRGKTSPNSPQAKHNLSTTANALESDIKKARTYNSYAEKPSTSAKIVSEIQKARNFYPHFNLSSWGLNENAVSSWETWDIVNPVKYNKDLEDQIVVQNEAISDTKETRDAATNTYSSDLELLSKESNSVKIKAAYNRDINKGLCINPFSASPPKRTLLHKGSMTDDVLSAEESALNYSDKEINNLATLFPTIPIEYLRDVFEKCKCDVNWTVDILLDDTREILPLDAKTVQNSDVKVTEDNLPENLCDLKINDSPVKNACVKKNTGDDISALQKHIENIIDIGANYYSGHVLKLKEQRQAMSNDMEKTSTSQTIPKLDFQELSTLESPTVVISDSEDSEQDFDFIESDNEEIIELNLGDNVITQLETKLGFQEVIPQGFLPLVQLPISFARQLYATYVESVLGQMELQNQVLETIVKQDEEVALKLQQQEQAMQNIRVKAPDLNEIMNEQAAYNIYQTQTEQWKNETPDNLAMKMTLQKLSTAFPRVNVETLREIYHAYNNSYYETVDVLLSSTDPIMINDPDGTLKEPPITEMIVTEMKEAEDDLKHCIHSSDVSKTAQEYRDEANLHFSKHSELIQKALQAYQRKQYPVAQFYSDIAKTHTQLYDQANNLAASAFLNEHSQKLQNFYTLDLHFLYVKEAIAALDIFIDKNIHLLNEGKPSENLFIITGRGKRSEQGKSKLKPVVMGRLRKRKIRYWELNPGLLKIRVLYTSSLTSNIC